MTSVAPTIQVQEGFHRGDKFNDYIARKYKTNGNYVSQYKKLASMVAKCPQMPYMVFGQREWTKTQLLASLNVIDAAIYRHATAQHKRQPRH